ncbi:PTPRV-like protein [Mya arenaria]|uniref:PTPRV-like protein n=1 Tax=Mya arenaria TaxID=6604 RepID=A0ABY7F792_MYAAR|nr:PTPRV-like protein [Mya arenaria]
MERLEHVLAELVGLAVNVTYVHPITMAINARDPADQNVQNVTTTVVVNHYSCGKGCLYNKCEKSNGQCLCKTDLFNGHYCVSCVDGKYGQDCNNDCPGSCHSCSEATACTSCKPGFFGSVCERKCSESCESCSEMGQCLTCKTGNTHPDRQCLCQKNMCSTPDSCDQCVSDEYYPDSGSCCPCSLLQHCKSCRVTSNITKCIACEEGFYPNEIGECINCSLICIAGQCNSLTGECLIGCASNYWGQLCERECKDSCNTCNRSNGECFECASKLTYGLNCNINCSETCVDKECYISGKCINGCLENNFGEMCDNECDKICISNGNGTRCSSESGKCLHGCTPGYTSIVCPHVPEGETQTLSGSPAAALSGGVAGAVILIITIIAVIAFFHHRKRRAENSTNKTTKLKTDQHEEQQVDSSAVYATVNKNIVQSDAIYANTVDGAPQITVISNQNFQRPSEKNTSSEMIYKEDNLEIDDEDAIARKIAIRFEENGGVYYNNSYEVNKTKVKVEELPAYVAGKTKSSYEEEFEKFPYVCHETDIKEFTHGFKKRNEYIATLGPTSKQLGDFGLFWETVWQQKVEKVVMVTNLIEENKDKCDQYWPNVDRLPVTGTIPKRESFTIFISRAGLTEGHWRKKRFLVAQTPLPETVEDFLTLIYQESCSCIVSFETDIGNNESVGLYFPAENQVLNKRAFSVESLRQDGKAYNTRRTLMLRHTGEHKETNEISIPQLEFTAWDSSRNTPRSASEFLDFIDDVEEASRASTSGGPILIHCIPSWSSAMSVFWHFSELQHFKSK